MAAQSQEAPPSEWKSQSLIGKVSSSLQLPLEVPVASEIISALRRALRTTHAHCTGWSSLRNKLFITLLEQKKNIYDTVVVNFIGDFKYEM